MPNIRTVGSGEMPRVGCSFCGKTMPDVAAIALSRVSTSICDECFTLAFQAFMDRHAERADKVRKYRALLKREIGWDDAEIDKRLAEITGQ